ncbi:hypothetical protein RND71_026497 [Anisodus tanguticus]|uniref:Nucleobase-ascorbate transporter 6 n=1 Tax=Anisodus tanguticus TaxID=243964 RepID=A0AAE1RP04_9SOLA|nr:hypothetical protein RND71_026497 [Anisodus tanguticus]
MAGGGAAPAAKSDDPAPHPTKDQLPNVSYCITSPPPWPEAILLGFQHYLVMLGTTVIIPTALVPQMGGGNEEKAKVIQTLLFVSGLNTLLQTSFGTRLPAVIGGSYTFVAPTISIILSGRWEDPDPVSRFKKIMRATQGALIVASTLQIVLGFSGLWRNVVRFLTPLSAVPLVSLVGFGLYEFGFPGYLAHLIRPGKHIFDRFAVLFTVAIVWIYAYILTVGGAYNGKPQKTQISCRTDRAGLIGAAPWIRVPYPFQWGAPSFDAGEAFAMMMATFVALVESTGAFIAVARYASATPMPPSILSRGVGWQVNVESRDIVSVFLDLPFPPEDFALACDYCIGKDDGSRGMEEQGSTGSGSWKEKGPFIISLLLFLWELAFYCRVCSAPGMVLLYLCKYRQNLFQHNKMAKLVIQDELTFPSYTCSENTGLLALTRVGSRRVVQISAGFMIFFSILGKFGAIFASIPAPIVGALYCLFFAYVGVGGLSFLQFCNLNSFRNKFILGFSIFLGLSVPQYFNEYTVIAGYGPVHTHGRWFNDMVNVPFSSEAFVACILAYFLDNTMHKKDSSIKKDRGKPWWNKFRSFKSDTRSEEFYSLPFNLNKYFPSV